MKKIFMAIAEILRAVIDPCGAAKWINEQTVFTDAEPEKIDRTARAKIKG